MPRLQKGYDRHMSLTRTLEQMKNLNVPAVNAVFCRSDFNGGAIKIIVFVKKRSQVDKKVVKEYTVPIITLAPLEIDRFLPSFWEYIYSYIL